MTARFIDNAEKNRFEYHVGTSFAYANYRRKGKELFIDKVEAPVELRGTGAAGNLMQNIVGLAKAEGLVIVPVCSYAAAWMQRRQKPRAPKP
ncbi:MAG: N-acetyltransferase [Alphaproteobacteria bacterium]|nr:MAG: N-acetyltransferase [Alphaproteobacteria bacterium]